jgi:DNA-binding MarR family transcriptional regulator
MDREKLKTLRLLEAVDSRELITQRELARDLNVSLGMVNAFMKRLVRKGYFKVVSLPKHRRQYLVTPEGAREKSRLTYEYIRYAIGFYREIRAILLALLSRLQREGVRRIALYGCGEVAELAHLFLQNTPIVLVGVFDDRNDGRRFFGHPVQNREALVATSFEYILLTHTEDIQTHHDGLVACGVKPECILKLEDQLFPQTVHGRRCATGNPETA